MKRIFVDSFYIYCAYFSAGVCILEYSPSGQTENKNTNKKLDFKKENKDEDLIYDFTGKLIKKENINNLPKGIYFIKKKDKKGFEKFIKVK
ncbi:MAG: hypothetical protein N2323_01085 [candidate division WOR-3 bacterium]|nr:hypothetical protein [candidate division WOR-3 bacterium]MCX7836540.1 hypothetical protein [candidate division WOR-3 bacterium]MDW8113885.1 hypothetical protein [candidate division WOR-3 bacterium]